MNAQEQKQFKIDWVTVLLIPLLAKLISLLGDEAKEILDGLFDKAKGDGGVKTQDGGETCPQGTKWDNIQKRCVPDIG